MACKRSGVQIPLAPRETAGQSTFTHHVVGGTTQPLQPLVQPHGPTVTLGTCSATGPRMFAKARRARLAELQNYLSQTDPAGEWSFKPADPDPNALRNRTTGGVEAAPGLIRSINPA